MTISTLIESFLDLKRSIPLSKNTLRTYSNVLRAWAKTMQPNHSLSDLLLNPDNTLSNIGTFVSTNRSQWAERALLRNNPLKKDPNTRRLELSILNIFFKNLLDLPNLDNTERANLPIILNGLIKLRPRSTIRLPVILTNDQVRSLITHCVRDDVRIIIEFLALSGLRAEEVLTLTHDNLILIERHRFIHLSADHTKGRKERVVPLTPRLEELYPQVILAITEGAINTYPKLFGYITRAARRASLRNVTPHTLRRTFATLALNEAGMSLKNLQQILGHSDIKTTQRYIGVNLDHARNTMPKL